MEIKNTSPKSCFLGWCLPLTKEEYYASLAEGNKRDFLRSQIAVFDCTPEQYWDAIYRDVAEDFQNLLMAVEQHGVKTVRALKLADLHSIRNNDVFTIIAHYSDEDDFIELSDGLYSSKEFADALPSDYEGIYDLTACHGVHIRNAIRKKCGNQIISFCSALSATIMLVFYKNLIANLAKYEINYIDCYTKMVEDLRKLTGSLADKNSGCGNQTEF